MVGSEMRYLLLTAYCISLLALRRLEALRAEGRPDNNRFPNDISDQRQDQASATGSQINISIPPPDPRPYLNWPSKQSGGWASSRPKMALTSLAWARPQGRTLRARRYSHSRGSRGHHQNQLMRVGCVLGTCQVQNLSHRLYQLIGQSGREDSSPMNPQSPHSYG